MDFDNRKVYGDTSIADGLVVVVVAVQVVSEEDVAAEAAGHEELWLPETASS